MALVHISILNVQARADTGSTMPIPNSVEAAADTMQSSAASAQSTITAATGRFWSITTKGDIWVKFGVNPTAITEEGHLIVAGSTRFFAVTAANEKVAIKDAA